MRSVNGQFRLQPVHFKPEFSIADIVLDTAGGCLHLDFVFLLELFDGRLQAQAWIVREVVETLEVLFLLGRERALRVMGKEFVFLRTEDLKLGHGWSPGLGKSSELA